MQTREMLDEQQEAIRKPLYKVGDGVKIISYGHIISRIIDNKLTPYDVSPELVGKKGIIDNVIITQNIPKYSISGIKGKHAWYDEGQLQLIKTNIFYKLLQYCKI